ncbi:MAG TPA: MerR family transcriptional regulator [Acidimicrobiia bacterium]|nr:MerR family transcriptional regulator [Acidimicrobiia bacterium]
MDELRVEELARRTDTSVDTIRFYQKRHLLDPPRREGRVAWYGPEHLARLQRIRELQARGFSLAVIRRLLDGELDAIDEPLAAAVADAAGEELLTLDELAARAGVPAALLDTVVREGLLVPRNLDGEACFAASDATIVAAGLTLLEVGFPLPSLLALAHRHHDATRDIAEEAVRLFDTHVREPLRASHETEAAQAAQLVDAFRTLLPAVTTLVAHHFRSVLLEVAQEHLEAVGEPAELDAARAEPGWSAPGEEAAQ